ncbi:MJ0144 family RNA dihydrouridine synthase-like protein [Methanocaldococcus indicus]|uniref:MJ0144 family RNA dihydrouridine synthase-like protein n=1 Tax=Methanocaldococcus indicus TaxID=213231 RepID=UPI003C6D8FDC
MIAIAPMAGYTDGKFCRRYEDLFDIVTLGGYNLDKYTLKAAKLITERGRKEFIIDLDKFNEYIINEIELIKKAKVNVNVRFLDIEEAYEKLEVIDTYADFIELNCHCRQKEITSLGLGQELLKNRYLLYKFLNKMDRFDKVLLKIRLNYIPLNDLIDTLNYVRELFYGLHIDCFYPNKPYPDIESLKIISEEFKDKFIIGNNSIDSLERAKEMLKYSDCISIARALLKNKIDWVKLVR